MTPMGEATRFTLFLRNFVHPIDKACRRVYNKTIKFEE